MKGLKLQKAVVVIKEIAPNKMMNTNSLFLPHGDLFLLLVGKHFAH